MLAAGLLAKEAVERGLAPKPWVKTSLAPGSRVVADYLADAGLQPFLDRLGYHVIGYGCTTCMGNSGPLSDAVRHAVEEHGVVGAAVLSGNRNFEGRIHPLAKVNYICSPPMVVAYALAGSVRRNLTSEPLGNGSDGAPVFLSDIWPAPEELEALVATALTPERFARRYADAFTGERRWTSLQAPRGDTFAWDPASSYMKEPPFFLDLSPAPPEIADIRGARVLALLGDTVTTDHISPVGTITASSAAGQYLQSLGIAPADFNSFAARRVNDRVMTRGAFANIRIRNEMVPEREGGWTRLHPAEEIIPIHEAADACREAGVPLVVIAGKDYGAGSSRDWAAKGTGLLGVRAVVAEGFERIHRSNLIGMGVLPLQFVDGATRETLDLDGSERFDVLDIAEGLSPRRRLRAIITRANGRRDSIELLCRLDTLVELEYYRNGGILHYVARQTLGHA
jgi:aconitate hydratase